MTNQTPINDLERDLQARLRLIDPTGDAGNGMLFADAAATLIAVDAVQAEVKPGIMAQLTEAELAAGMKVVADLLGGCIRRDVTLPFGTTARVIDPGLVLIDDQHYVMVDTRGGMMRQHEAPVSQEGPNLELLLQHLRQAISGQPCSALGLPSAITEAGSVDEHLLHFAPCATAGGVSLDVPLDCPIHQLPHDAFDDIVQLTAWAMEIFWKQRKALARRVRNARALFEAEVALAGSGATGLTVSDFRSRPFEFVDSNCETLHEKLSLYIGLTTFDAALRRGVEHWMLIGKVSAKQAIQTAVKTHVRTAARVAHGAQLCMDGLAATIAMAAPEGLAAVLQRLSRDIATDVVWPISRGRQLVSRLYWSAGTVRSLQYHHHHVQFHEAEVTLRDYPLPETLQNALVGRRLDEIIELPMPCALTVREIEEPYTGSRILHLNDVVYDIDFASGTIEEGVPF